MAAARERLSLAGRIARAKRSDPQADVTELRRELKTAELAEDIERLVNTWPPLTNEQRVRLALLLCPRTGGGSS
jgi:hypothetical protein